MKKAQEDEKIEMVPVDRVRVLNPRVRDKRKFEQIVKNIANVGLKKPITVSVRAAKDGQSAYDLVCGQGRLEAFIALGHQEIPAVVIQATREERLLMSLVENIARRAAAPLDLVREIQRLKQLGHSNTAIGAKLDISATQVNCFLALMNAGEERLIEAAIMGHIPLHVGVEIAKTEGVEAQRELLKAYEAKQVTHTSIRAIRRIIEQRRFLGKKRGAKDLQRGKARTSADSLVAAYRRETQRQKVMIRKAKICDSKLVFLVTALRKLVADENFINLLRAEDLDSMPRYLSERIATQGAES